MSGWRWIDKRALCLLHDESLAEHGGAPGLCDDGLLESVLARPRVIPSWTATSGRRSWRSVPFSR